MSDDIHMRYLQQYYKDHGSIADVEATGSEFVIFDGQKIYIAKFLSRMREEHRKYIDPNKRGNISAKTLTRFNRLEKMNFSWEKTRKKRGQLALDEKPIKYLKYHYSQNKTINDISYEDVVEFEGEELKIGAFIKKVCHDHYEYLRGEKKASSPIHLMRYSFFEDMEFEWDNEKRNAFRIVSNDIMIRYLKYHYSKHKTINDIGCEDVVIFEEQELNIGTYLTRIRTKHREYIKDSINGAGTSLLSQERYRILESMGIEWVRQPKAKAILANEQDDPYIKFLQEYYQEHGTINNIPEKKIIEVNGEKLQIGAFLQRIRARFREDSQNNFANVPELRQIRYQALQELEFSFQIPEKGPSLNQIARENNIDEQLFQRLVKKLSGDKEKAIKIIKSLEKINRRKEQETQKDLIISKFLQQNNLSLRSFLIAINKKSIINNKKQVEYNDEMTLEEFCLVNKYNFGIISKAIRLKTKLLPEEDFSSLINRVVVDTNITTKRFISSWIYAAYPNVLLIRSLLTENNLSWESVFRNIRENIYTLDEALVAEAFRSNRENGQLYLEGLYYEYVDLAKKLNNNPDKKILLEEYKEHIVSEYSLTEEEIGTITKSFTTYEDISHQIQLLDVAFEKNPEIKETKIIQYNFTEKDIEEALLFPLSFQETEVIGKNSELYQRRQLIKNITSTWQSLSSEEKNTLVDNNNLTPTEISYVISTTKAIASTKEKVLKKQ